MSSEPSISGSSFIATNTPVGSSNPLNVSSFISATKPGNVAVCLSGGGSRALSAGMGQLLALETVLYASNESLLSQTKALSTVSGGSWLGVPFTYLPSSVSDADYLGGPYVEPNSLTPASLGSLPSTCAGANITSDFTVLDMALQALFLYKCEDVPAATLWRTIIGLHLLKPFDLFSTTGDADTPTSFFTYDQTALAVITSANSSLKEAPVNLVSTQPRPFLVCNTALFVNNQTLLVPVQATSFISGIMSTPPGATDANGFAVGGGGVTSFALSSTPTNLDSSTSQVTIKQGEQWALADIVGSSSAAYAATLEGMMTLFSANPEMLALALRERGSAAVNFLRRKGCKLPTAHILLRTALLMHREAELEQLRATALSLTDLLPAYQYWPVANPPIGLTVDTTEFADGGNLENTGIASILAYGDIDNVISFVNSATPLTKDKCGVIIVDDSIPPLFGYQPYVSGTGYVLYAGTSDPACPLFQKSKVFSSHQFKDLLENLWSACDSYQNAPVYSQTLTTVTNSWFGVASERNITVLWVYLERVKGWYDQLSTDVQAILGDFDSMLNNFPHYSTLLDTELSQTEINLLANLTAWVVMNGQDQFNALFPSS